MKTANHFKLPDGRNLPPIGFGTFRINPGEDTFNAVSKALKSGYRLIDTAERYENEESVGKAVRASGIDRSEILITTKLFNTNRGSYDKALRACENSLRKLDCGPIDLYLIHWPESRLRDGWEKENLETWRALERLQEEGMVKHIGLCNYTKPYLEHLLANANTKPVMNQIEMHPGYWQKETLDLCLKEDIIPEAWGTFANGDVFKSFRLKDIATKYNRSTAQICLRWLTEKGVLPLAKSVGYERILSNMQIFDFSLSIEDHKFIDEIEQVGGACMSPDDYPPV